MKRAAVTARARGFTLIELIVVIAVIGILATITVIGFGKFQGDTRDARRSSSANVISESLEKYYDQNGEYPNCTQLTGSGATVSQSILKNVSPSTLVAPQAASSLVSQQNSIQCTSAGNTLTTTGPDFFEYTGDGSPECAGTGACLSYTLRYKSESDGTIKSIASRRTTSIATSGNITNLQANSTSFTTISLSWSSVDNATGYNVQMSASSSFTSPTNSVSATAGASIGGLTAGNTYYFRVQPINGNTTGSWSNTASATTRSLATPVGKVVANANGTTNVFSWGAISGATNYRVQRGTSSGFGSGTYTEYSQTATSKTFTDEVPGVTHYYRVIATATGDTSDPSTPVTMTTATPPADYTISRADPTYNKFTATSNAKCAAGTTPYYKWTKRTAPSTSYVAWVEGTQYKSVSVTLSWNVTVTVNSYTLCKTSTFTSAYTNGSNTTGRMIASPTMTTGLNPLRTFNWAGTCPSGTTSLKVIWKIKGDGSVNTSGQTTSASGKYANTGTAWGDGNGRATIYCYSAAPYGWSGAVTATSYTAFGPGCVTSAGVAHYTKSICMAQ